MTFALVHPWGADVAPLADLERSSAALASGRLVAVQDYADGLRLTFTIDLATGGVVLTATRALALNRTRNTIVVAPATWS